MTPTKYDVERKWGMRQKDKNPTKGEKTPQGQNWSSTVCEIPQTRGVHLRAFVLKVYHDIPKLFGDRLKKNRIK